LRERERREGRGTNRILYAKRFTIFKKLALTIMENGRFKIFRAHTPVRAED
jgi:hypothetical protein